MSRWQGFRAVSWPSIMADPVVESGLMEFRWRVGGALSGLDSFRRPEPDLAVMI